jgi:hypothetical protein
LRETIALQVGDPAKDFPHWPPATRERLETAQREQPQPAVQPVHSLPYPVACPDDIFRDLEARAGAATIAAAAETMLTRALHKGLAAQPWSLAELGPTDYDFIWLRVWLKRLDANTVRYCQSPFRRFTALGQRRHRCGVWDRAR